MDRLNWDATFAIANQLKQRHASVMLDDVSLEMVYTWTLELPNFHDDPALATDEILTEIYREWYEAISIESDRD